MDHEYTFGNDVTTDTSGNGYHLTSSVYPVLETSTASCKGSKCVKFDEASSQYLNLPAHSFGQYVSGFTFSFWFKSDGGGNEWTRIFDFGNGESSDNILVTKDLYFRIQRGTSESSTNLDDPTTGVWTHVVWTINPSSVGSTSAIWNIYIDGSLKSTETDMHYPKDIVLSNMYLGRSNKASESTYNGWIDDFRIFGYAVTADEALLLYVSVSSPAGSYYATGSSTPTEVSSTPTEGSTEISTPTEVGSN
jgi:hypothetical protein